MTQEERNEAMIQGINRFLFCNWNFATVTYKRNIGGEARYVTIPQVIAEAKWTCGVEHMIDKWFAATKSGNTDAYFARFYAELSNDNRRAFLEWIVTNYTKEQKL